MLSRCTLKFTPDPTLTGSELTLEQRLAGRATSCTVWLKILGFLIANVLTNSFSLIGLAEGSLGSGIIIGICVVAALGTIYANFISKTVVACNPIDPLKLSTPLKRLYNRLEMCIKENKDRYGCKETFLIMDPHELVQLRVSEISLSAVGGKRKKFDVAMHLLANRYGPISILSPTEAMAEQKILGEKHLIVAVTSDLSDPMLEYIIKLPEGTKAFNFDSYWDGVSACGKFTDFLISLPRWSSIKAWPSLVLVNQGITTTLSLLNKIPGFSNSHWGLQIGSFAFSALLVGWSRVDINNVLKGDRAVAETRALAFTVSKLYRSCRKRRAGAVTEQLLELQVSHPVAITAVIIALASVGLTVYYNYATACFYSPDQAADLLVKQLNRIPGIDSTPTTLINMGEFIKHIQSNVLYKGQIISAIVLSFLTSCKSTLDRVLNWLYKPAQHSKTFCEKTISEKFFVAANITDSGTFGVNATFNSYNINHNTILAILTGVGIVVTHLIWGSETKNIPIARAIITCGDRPAPKLDTTLPTESTLRIPLLEDKTEADSSKTAKPVGDAKDSLAVAITPSPIVRSDEQRSSLPPSSPTRNRYRLYSSTPPPPLTATILALPKEVLADNGAGITHIAASTYVDSTTPEKNALRC